MIAGYQRSNWRVFRRVYKEHFRFPEPAPCERACGANYDPLMAKRLGATGMRGCAAARATVCKSRGLLRMCEDNPPERHHPFLADCFANDRERLLTDFAIRSRGRCRSLTWVKPDPRSAACNVLDTSVADMVVHSFQARM